VSFEKEANTAFLHSFLKFLVNTHYQGQCDSYLSRHQLLKNLIDKKFNFKNPYMCN